MRLLPSSLALAQLRGDFATAEALLTLLETSGATGFVQYPFIPAEEIWRSLAEEVQDRLRLGFEEGGFVRMIESPLAHGSSARVGRLRLYGDAICVPAAQAFIEAYLETENRD